MLRTEKAQGLSFVMEDNSCPLSKWAEYGATEFINAPHIT